MSIEGTYLSIIKAIFDKPTINIIYSMKVQSFSYKIKDKTKLSTPTAPILHSMKISVRTLGKNINKKAYKLKRKEMKLSPSAENMTLHTLPWTRWVWITQVHLYMDFFQYVCTTVLHIPWLVEFKDATGHL